MSLQMRTLIIYTLALGVSFTSARAQLSSPIDVENLFPNVGAAIVWADPNNAGVPPGVLGACSGTLIHERIFLTAGHCTRVSEDGIPPLIHIFVTFNLHVFDDRSTWIPVIAQAWHPSTLPCPHNSCPWPDPPVPGLHDVGLMFLAIPVHFTKPAGLAHPGALDSGRGDSQDQIVVGYGFADSAPQGGPLPWSQWEGIRHYRVISPRQAFDAAWAFGSQGDGCFGDSGGPTFLGPLGESGNKRRAIITTASAFLGASCSTGRSVVARIDNEDVQSWIAQQIKQWLPMHQD